MKQQGRMRLGPQGDGHVTWMGPEKCLGHLLVFAYTLVASNVSLISFVCE